MKTAQWNTLHILALALLALVCSPVSLWCAPPQKPAPKTQATPAPQNIVQVIREAASAVDGILARHWAAAGIQPNPPLDDETFVRRVYLDIAGRIPTPSETAGFLQWNVPDKRDQLIRGLLGSEAYVLHFCNVWADILRLQSHSTSVGPVTGGAYAQFIKESLRTNKPYDQLVRELITADKPAWENGAVGYHIRDAGMNLDAMALTSRIFLGTRIECAQCHNHPFDKWTQMDFYKLAAYTFPIEGMEIFSMIGINREMDARTRRIDEQWRKDRATLGDAEAKKRRDHALETTANPHRSLRVLRNMSNAALRDTLITRRDRELKLPHDYHYTDAKPGDVIQPKVPFGPPAVCPPGKRRDTVFAEWLTSAQNPRFTTVIVNRMVNQVFGRALIEPLDELRDDSKASVPELETYLERLMVALRYDLRMFLAVLLNTRAYQSECTPAETVRGGDAYPFTGPVLRRMSAEQIWDSCIALMRPDPDAWNDALHGEHEHRIRRAYKTFDAFKALPVDQLLTRAMEASGAYDKGTERIQRIQTQIDEAKEKGETQTAARLGKELLNSSSTDSQMLEQVFFPMLSALARQKGAPAIPPFESLRANIRLAMDAFPIPGYDLPEPTPAQRDAARESRAKTWIAMSRLATPATDGEQKKYAQFLEAGRTEWVRAAELESPAPRGHFLRELGQSDRDLVENANLDASVSHALIFMNSNLVSRVLSPLSPLMLRMRSAGGPREQLDMAYFALFSRRPNEHEKKVWSQISENARTPETLVHALLNTRQFLFIQ